MSLTSPVLWPGLLSAGPRDIRSCLEKLTCSELSEHLRLLLADSEALSRVASQSYQHDNDFMKVVLAKTAFSASVRLHVWKRSSYKGNIHNHRWQFASRVLCGSVREELFTTEAGLGYSLYTYKRIEPSKYSLEFVQEVTAVRTALREWHKGQTYVRSPRRLHRVIVPETSFTTTLVVCQPAVRRVTDVVSEDPRLQGTRTVEEGISVGTLVHLLHQTITELDGCHGD